VYSNPDVTPWRPAGTDAPRPDDLTETIRALIAMMASGNITKLDLSFGDVSIRLRGQPLATTASADSSFTDEMPAPSMPLLSSVADHIITAPMIGTFYTAASPGDPPFVRAGDQVEVGQAVGIIEAMKIMNEITADRTGTVTEIFVANAQPVEYGSPLLRMSLADEPEE